MAKEHRIRVVVGHDEEGNEIIKRLSATDELKLADKVIEAVVKSGRIKDFIDQEIEYGPHEKQVQEEAAQPPVVKTKFSDYIVQWRRICENEVLRLHRSMATDFQDRQGGHL